MGELKVGDYIYVFRKNWRQTKTKEEWIKQWVLTEIQGETRVSWVLESYGREVMRVNKRALAAGALEQAATSDYEIEMRWWDDKNRHRIAEAIRRISTQQLVKVADLIGYKGAGP